MKKGLSEMQVRMVRVHADIAAPIFSRLWGVSAETIRRARRGETFAHLDAHLDRTQGTETLPPGIKVPTEAELAHSLAQVIVADEQVAPEVMEILKKYGER